MRAIGCVASRSRRGHVRQHGMRGGARTIARTTLNRTANTGVLYRLLACFDVSTAKENDDASTGQEKGPNYDGRIKAARCGAVGGAQKHGSTSARRTSLQEGAMCAGHALPGFAAFPAPRGPSCGEDGLDALEFCGAEMVSLSRPTSPALQDAPGRLRRPVDGAGQCVHRARRALLRRCCSAWSSAPSHRPRPGC